MASVNFNEIWYNGGKAALHSKVFPYNKVDIVSIGGGRTIEEAMVAFYDAGLHNDYKILPTTRGSYEKAKDLGIKVIKVDDIKGGRIIHFDGYDQGTRKRFIFKGGIKVTENGLICLGDNGKEGLMMEEKEAVNRANFFIALGDHLKLVKNLGDNEYMLPAEIQKGREDDAINFFTKVMNMGTPIERKITHSGNTFRTKRDNVVFDVPFNAKLYDLQRVEETLIGEGRQNGIVANGLFASRKPDHLIVSYPDTVKVFSEGRDKPRIFKASSL